MHRLGRSWPLAVAWLVLLAGSSGAAARSTDGPEDAEAAVGSPAPPEPSLVPALAKLLRSGRLEHPEERAARARAVAAMGPEAAIAVLDVLIEGRFLGLGGARSEAALRPGERDVLERVVRLTGAAPARSLMDAARREQDAAARGRGVRRALEILAHCGSAADLELAFELVRDADPDDPATPRLQGDLERVVREISGRDAAALRLGVSLLGRAPEALAASLARGLAASGQPLVLRALAEAKTDRPELRAVLLSQFARAARSASHPIDDWILRDVRRFLEDEDLQVARMAAAAAAGLWDFEAMPALIKLLGKDPALAREARTALTQLAGKDLGAEAPAWSSWLQGERGWWSSELPRITSELQYGEPGEAVAALRELGGRRYRRTEILRLVEPCLFHESPGVRKSACEAFIALAVPGSASSLVPLLEDDDLGVARAALSALVALTGQRHPPETAAWNAALDLR